jgi:hypothetical protein
MLLQFYKMKRISTFTILYLLVANTFAQTDSVYGNWFYLYLKKEPKTHWSQPLPFPQMAADYEGRVTYTLKEKEKMGKILEALKEVYPRPKLHSYFFEVKPFFNLSKWDKAKVAKRDYRFGYGINFFSKFVWIDDNKVNKNKPIDWTANMDAGIRTFGSFNPVDININYIPDFLGGIAHNYEGPEIVNEKSFTYKKVNGKETNQARDLERGYVVSITARDETFQEAEKHLGKNYGVPSLQLGNGADKYFVYRKFSSSALNLDGNFRVYGKFNSEEPRHKIHTTSNMVIMSHNGKLPLLPLSIETYLNICEKICDEQIEYFKLNKTNNPSDYEKNKKHYDKLEADNIASVEGNKLFLQKLKEEYKGRLNDHAIVNIAFNEAFGYRKYDNFGESIYNSKTGKLEPIASAVKIFFITNSKLGKAFYSYDKNFYKGMADGEIRTIAIVWNDVSRAPDHPDFGKENNIDKDQVNRNEYTDNPNYYLHYFQKKFDWKKLEALLGK